jgi:flagellar M-ring protein FliF
LTVAVLVDGNYEEEETEDGEVSSTYIPRTEEELKQIAAIVKQAIGLDESPPRNDKFEIQSVEFQHHLPVYVDEESVAKADKKEFILSIARSSSLVIAVLAFLLFAKKALKSVLVPKRATAGAAANYAAYEAPLEIEEQVNEIDAARQGKMNEKRIELRDGIIDNTKADPKTTSNLVRKWLRESDQ